MNNEFHSCDDFFLFLVHVISVSTSAMLFITDRRQHASKLIILLWLHLIAAAGFVITTFFPPQFAFAIYFEELGVSIYTICVGTVKVFQEVIVTQFFFIQAYFPNNLQFLWSAALLTSWVISYLPRLLETWNLSCHIKNNLTGKSCRVVVELVVELLRQTAIVLTDPHIYSSYWWFILILNSVPS